MLGCAHFTGKDNKSVHDRAVGKLAIPEAYAGHSSFSGCLGVTLFLGASDCSAFLCLFSLCINAFLWASLKDLQPLQEHTPPVQPLDKGECLTQRDHHEVLVEILTAQAQGKAVTRLLTAVRVSFLCILVSPAEWPRHCHH